MKKEAHEPANEPAFPLPAEILSFIHPASLVQDLIGCSQANVYKVNGLTGAKIGERRAKAKTSAETEKGETAAYLKVSRSGYDDSFSLSREKAVLDWLAGRLPVPRVLYFRQQDGWEYLLISEVPGRDASHPSFRHSAHAARTMVQVLAQGLRMMHGVAAQGCPFSRTLDVALAEARKRVEQDRVDSSDFQPENLGRTPQDIYEELLRTRPPAEDLVFTHGDYCLPNIILRDNQLSGFIDLGRAGVADRYQDLALAIRSIKYNLGDGFADVFLQAYCLNDVDQDKIKYYILLDELF